VSTRLQLYEWYCTTSSRCWLWGYWM